MSDATKTESAEIVKSVVGRLDSKIAGVVRNEFLKMRTYAICKLKNEFALLKEKPIFFVERDANGVFFAISVW